MTTVKISPEVLAILKRCIVNANRLTVPFEPDGTPLDRKLYEGTNKIINLLGGKWNKGAKAHVFPNDAGDILADAIMTGEVVDLVKLYQFFPTPDNVADRMVRRANLSSYSGMTKGQFPLRILEPSAGNGSLIQAINRYLGFCPKVDAYELDKSRLAMLSDLVGVDVVGEDFIAADPTAQQYDRIIANPPFRNAQDVSHVEHMWKFLAPGGTIVTLTSPGWTYRKDDRHNRFRAFMEDHTWEQLPAGSFRPSGTDVSVILCVLHKQL